MVTTQFTTGRENKVMVYAVSLSLLIHIVFFGVFIIFPEFSGKRTIEPQPIFIHIVGGDGDPGPITVNPADTGTAPVEATASDKLPISTKPEVVAPVHVPEPPQVQVIEPSVYAQKPPEDTPVAEDPVAPEVVPDNVATKASQSTKTKDAAQKVEQVLQQLQNTAQQSSQAVQQAQTGQESVASAVDQLRQKLANEQAGATGSGTGVGSGGGAGVGHGGPGGPEAVYLGIIVPIIEKSWSFAPAMFNGHARMQVIVSCRIMPSGEVTDIKFVSKSGNAYLDESAFRAMAKSSPLPSFANSGIKRPYLELQFRFTPQGLQL